jgi:hypothetical protein
LPSNWAELFSNIGMIDAAKPETWDGRLFLTIDLDWAIDPAIELCLDLIEEVGIAATVFVTHDTPLLARMRTNPRLELGLHPNFNSLLDGVERPAGGALEIMRNLQQIVPEARVVRSHSMTQSSKLLDLFVATGMTHDCNHFIPAHTGIPLRPYRHWNGLTRVPYFWEDDVDLIYRAGPAVLELAAGSGLKVFDFHPIHIALNTQSTEHYESSRAAHRSWDALLRAASNERGGVRNRFVSLLSNGGAA